MMVLAMESGMVLGVSDFYLQILILGSSILAVAFFSSSEAALLAVNKERIRHLAAEGQGSAKAVERVLSKHDKFFSAILLTENAFLIFASSVGTVITFNLIDRFDIKFIPPELLATFVLTIIIVQFGKIMPKTLAARGSGIWSLVVARPVQWTIWIETWILFLFTLIPGFIYRLAGGDPNRMAPSVTEGELRMLIGVAGTEGAVQKAEAEMLENVFHFGDRMLSESITPRPDIAWVERDTSLREFLTLYSRYPHSRYPVFENDVENIIGILSVKDVIGAIANGKLKTGDSVTKSLRPIYFAPESKPIALLFDELRASGNQIAVVVDDNGGVSGIVTMKQLLEVIVGDFGEEGEPATEGFVSTGFEQYELSAAMSIQEVNEKLDLTIPDGDYQTLAGYILKQLGRIPSPGDLFYQGELRFEVKTMRRLRIEQVEVRRIYQRTKSKNS